MAASLITAITSKTPAAEQAELPLGEIPPRILFTLCTSYSRLHPHAHHLLSPVDQCPGFIFTFGTVLAFNRIIKFQLCAGVR